VLSAGNAEEKTVAGAGIPLVMANPTYPFELISDARSLRDQAVVAKGRTSDNIPGR